MPTLAEILAAKKGATPAPTAAPAVAESPKQEIKTIPEPVKEEPANTAAPKPMSFAEKMALKKAQEAAQKTETKQTGDTSFPAALVGNATSPSVVSYTEQEKTSPKAEAPVPTAPAQDASQSGAPLAPTPAKEDTGTHNSEEVSVEARQAYTDIKEKLADLADKSGEDLKNAMSGLKRALMQNPAAVSLMQDSDIGQMVIALRKLTGQDIQEAAKEKKTGRKSNGSKPVDLTDPNAVAAIMDDL